MVLAAYLDLALDDHVEAVGRCGDGTLRDGRRGYIMEIMGSQKCAIVGKSQPVLIIDNPIIFTRTRKNGACHQRERRRIAASSAS
jgi:hypothetical protein